MVKERCLQLDYEKYYLLLFIVYRSSSSKPRLKQTSPRILSSLQQLAVDDTSVLGFSRGCNLHTANAHVVSVQLDECFPRHTS